MAVGCPRSLGRMSQGVMDSPMISLAELLRIPCVETEMGFDISPDGEKVAFSWNRNGKWDIYQTFVHGTGEPCLISNGPGSKFHPRYSPDGKSIAFAVDHDGRETHHLYILDISSGEQRDLTPNIQYSQQPHFSWSPDGKRIAFITDRTGQYEVYIISVKGGNSRHFFNPGFPAWKTGWSPDGLWLAVTVEAAGLDFNTFIVPAENPRAAWQIADEHGPIDAGQFCWSPDGKRLAFTSDLYGSNNVGIYDIGDRTISWVTDGEGDKQFPVWSPDGNRLAYVLNRSTISWIAVQNPGNEPTLYQVEAGVHYLPKFTKDGSHIVLGFDNPRHPTDLWLLTLDVGTFTAITNSMPGFLRDTHFSMPEEIVYPGMDGTPIPALLFRPTREPPGPAIIIIHGGPDWFFEMTWYPIMIHLASRGWTVLAPNYRGSTGYGRRWQEASRFDFGGVDNDDVAAGAQYLIKNQLANPKRIGLTGRSHGGYLTMTCLTKYPELWAVGSAVVPFINWFTNHQFIRPDLQRWDIENFGDPENNYDLWYERSPFFFLDRIKAPIQLLAGRQDQRCPVSDSIEAHESLQKLGKKSELVVYEDEGHVFLNLDNVLDSEQRRVNFLADYLE